MAWYDSVAGLTPIHAWDAIGHVASGGLPDRVGSVTCGTSWGAAINRSGVMQAPGDSTIQNLSSQVALPSEYTITLLFDPNATTVELLYDSSSTSEVWVDAAQMVSSRSASGTASNLGSVAGGVFNFLALTKRLTPNEVRAYINGAWGGEAQDGNFAPTKISMVGYGSGYNFRSTQFLSCLAIYEGAASLAQLQELEANARLAMMRGMFVRKSGGWVLVEALEARLSAL